MNQKCGSQKLQSRPSWDPAPDVRSRLRQRLRGESAWEEVVEALCCMRIALVQANAVAAITELMRASGPFNKVRRPETAAPSPGLVRWRAVHLASLQRRRFFEQALLCPSLQLTTCVPQSSQEVSHHMPDKPGGATQIFREDTGAWLVKPMGGFVRALRDVGTAANVQAKVPIGKNGFLGEAAAKMNALFSVAHQGAGAAPCLPCEGACRHKGCPPGLRCLSSCPATWL